MSEHQCPSCGGFCKKSGCERKDVNSVHTPAAWQVFVGADTPFNAPMGWQFYNTYDSLRSAEATARAINAAKLAPFAKVVPLYHQSICEFCSKEIGQEQPNIDKMVDRFLAWRSINFLNNLFTADQVRAMILHILKEK